MNTGLILALLLAGPPSPVADASGADALVRLLYQVKTIPTTSAAIDRFFAHDTAAAIKKDIAGGEVGETNDGDYRYDAQETQITGLKFQSRAVIGGAVTTVSFQNDGHPGKVIYRLCQRIGGEWRIYQVESQDFDMRKRLELQPSPVGC